MIVVNDLGLIDYQKSLEIQTQAVGQLILQKKNNSAVETIYVCEHPAVITVGRGTGSEAEVLQEHGAKGSLPLFEVSRGGRATVHLPGQVVVYPIVDLNRRGKDLHGFMRLLESAIIETLADFRIKGQAIEGKTGVWVVDDKGERKIASLGIAAKQWVSYHGLALNVNCDLSQFSKIKPCGFESSVMTSIEKEIPELYRQEWELKRKGFLFKHVKSRIVENLKELLT